MLATPQQQPKRTANFFARTFAADPITKIDLIRQGVPADEIRVLATALGMSIERVCRTLGFSVATINRKLAARERLSQEHSERVVALSALVGQVQAIVERSGQSKGFDAAKWTSNWIDQPLPALGNARPVDYLDTTLGLTLLSNLLGRIEHGTYA